MTQYTYMELFEEFLRRLNIKALTVYLGLLSSGKEVTPQEFIEFWKKEYGSESPYTWSNRLREFFRKIK